MFCGAWLKGWVQICNWLLPRFQPCTLSSHYFCLLNLSERYIHTLLYIFCFWLSPAKLSSVPHYGLATWWQFMERFLLLLCFFKPIRFFLTSQASSGLFLAAFNCLVIQLKIYFVFALAVEFKILQIISILVIYWVQ